jgi:RNA polymerase sigma-70 factor (ECF subfamily)
MRSEFQESADRYRNRIFTFARYCLGDQDDAQDVTQEVLVRLWKNWDSIEPERVEPWIIHVTRNACIDVMRRRSSYRKVVAPDPEGEAMSLASTPAPDPSALTETMDFHAHVERALSTLREPYRSIVVLREIQDYRYEEISAALDMPLNTVKVYLHRARRKLRKELREFASHEVE